MRISITRHHLITRRLAVYRCADPQPVLRIHRVDRVVTGVQLRLPGNVVVYLLLRGR